MSHRHLDDELTNLRNLLIVMAELVDRQLADAINAAGQGNLDLAKEVQRRDDEVDALELEIDQQCERILALFTPVAVDLRLIIAAVKVNTDLERIGDHAKNLAKDTILLGESAPLLHETRIPEMADAARRMLNQVQDAFIERDRVAARQVLAQDRQIDRLYEQTVATISRLLAEHPEKAGHLVHFITMSKGIERIADHVKNIAELVVFLVEGKDIRHRKLQEGQAKE